MEKDKIMLGCFTTGECVSITGVTKVSVKALKNWVGRQIKIFGDEAYDIRVIEAPSEEFKKYFEDHIEKVKNNHRQAVESL